MKLRNVFVILKILLLESSFTKQANKIKEKQPYAALLLN